jgi:hypothetical protein
LLLTFIVIFTKFALPAFEGLGLRRPLPHDAIVQLDHAELEIAPGPGAELDDVVGLPQIRNGNIYDLARI